MKVQILLFLFFFYGISAQTVYKTPSGTKYHLANCRMVKNVSSALSLDKALRSGLQPCKICRAPVGKTYGIISSAKKPARVNSNNRCHGTTKSGTRCKRNTRIGNNFCFQHLPK